MDRQRASCRAGPGKFARTIAAAVPIATLPALSFAPLAAPFKARYGCVVRKAKDVKKASENSRSRSPESGLGQIGFRRGKTSVFIVKGWHGANRACVGKHRGAPRRGIASTRRARLIRRHRRLCVAPQWAVGAGAAR